MAFEPEPTRTPVEVQSIVITLKDTLAHGDDPAYQAAYFNIKVELSDGTMKRRAGDLVPMGDPTRYITAAERLALMDFMTTLRARAESQILP